jgi:hypothetical protein
MRSGKKRGELFDSKGYKDMLILYKYLYTTICTYIQFINNAQSGLVIMIRASFGSKHFLAISPNSSRQILVRLLDAPFLLSFLYDCKR